MFSENGRVGIYAAYFKDNFSHNIPWVISAAFRKVSSRSRETKNHRHLSIKAFAFLNPCPKLIDVLIWITIKPIPQLPVKTCIRSNVPKCTQKSLLEWLLPSWIRMNPLLIPTFLRTKAAKRKNSPHTGESMQIWW